MNMLNKLLIMLFTVFLLQNCSIIGKRNTINDYIYRTCFKDSSLEKVYGCITICYNYMEEFVFENALENKYRTYCYNKGNEFCIIPKSVFSDTLFTRSDTIHAIFFQKGGSNYNIKFTKQIDTVRIVLKDKW